MKKFIAFLILGVLLFLPQVTEAHATLIQSTPSPNSQLKEAPNKVVLSFNERLQRDLYYIKVYDSEGHLVSESTTKMSPDHTQLSVGLKKLKNGTYTVSYHVISADGHPVGSSYLFQVGNGSDLLNRPAPEPANNGGQSGIAFSFYGIYELFFLAFAGWIFIGVLRREWIHQQKAGWYQALKLFFLISAVLLSLSDSYGALSGLSGSQWGTYFFHTELGLISLIRVLLAIIGVLILQRFRWLDGLWVVGMIALEAAVGHAAVFHPVPLTLVSDAVHLFAAAFWVGGLVFLLFHYKSHLKRFLPFFSNGAFISLLILVVTGFVLTLLFSPDISDVFKSDWGQLLVVKVFVVLLVFLTAAIIRERLKSRNPHAFKRWIKVDAALMFILMIIVGALTHLTPFPPNEPVYWKTDREGCTIATSIYPTNPGTVQTIQLAVQCKDRKMTTAEMTLQELNKEELAPFHISLKRDAARSDDDHVSYFTAKGSYLTIPGKWQLKLTIYDRQDNYIEVGHSFEIYRVKP